MLENVSHDEISNSIPWLVHKPSCFVACVIVCSLLFLANAVEKRKVVVERCYVERFMTSLQVAGVLITILQVDDNRLQILCY